MESQEEKSYWQGHRAGTARLTELQQQLTAKVEECLQLSALLDDARAELRQANRVACWHCQCVLHMDPPHCDQCPSFNSCHIEGCTELGCQT